MVQITPFRLWQLPDVLELSNHSWTCPKQAHTDCPCSWLNPKSPPAHSHHWLTNRPGNCPELSHWSELPTLHPAELSWLPADPAEWASSPATWAGQTWCELHWACPSFAQLTELHSRIVQLSHHSSSLLSSYYSIFLSPLVNFQT